LTFEAERQALEERFSTNWSETDVKWPNVKFSSKGRDEWVAFNYVPDLAREKSLGTDPVLNRYYGDIAIQIFVTPNSGAARALQLASLVSDIWRNVTFGEFTVQTPRLAIVGVNDGWYQVDVISPYYRDSFEPRSVL